MTQAIPVFVVSLARAPERRTAVCRHLEQLGIEYRLIDAVDGRALADDYIASIVAPGLTMHPGAVGCYLSHVHIYEFMRDENIPLACVLEDDAHLDPRIVRLLREGCDASAFDYCFLDSEDHNESGPIYYDADSGVALNATFTAYALSAGPQTTHAYMITRAAALKRLEHAYPLTCAIDLYSHLPYAIRFASLVNPKGAWVSAHSLASFTSAKQDLPSQLSLRFLRRWPWFYRLRDMLRMKDIKRNLRIRELVRQGKLANGPKWRALPSGREILLADEQGK